MAEYQSQIWRINTRTQSLQREPVPESWFRLGGRGLLARILLDEVDATCDLLGPGNKLIFAPGSSGTLCPDSTSWTNFVSGTNIGGRSLG